MSIPLYHKATNRVSTDGHKQAKGRDSMNSDTAKREALLKDGALTIDEATAFSGLGRTRLYNAMKSGRLAFVQHGRRRLIPRKALQQLLAEGLVESTRPAA